jgi:hypothetical protein
MAALQCSSLTFAQNANVEASTHSANPMLYTQPIFRRCSWRRNVGAATKELLLQATDSAKSDDTTQFIAYTKKTQQRLLHSTYMANPAVRTTILPLSNSALSTVKSRTNGHDTHMSHKGHNTGLHSLLVASIPINC